LANYFNNSLFVTLAWSAPGNDYQLGKAFRYEIRCFTARASLQENNFNEQGILVHQSLVPSPEQPGKEQRCTVGVPWPEEIFYYAVVAYDEAGNRGEVSNIISVYVKEPVTTSTEDATTISLEMSDVSKSLHLKSFLHSESLMYIIAGIISFILIIVVIILTVIVRRLGVCSRKEPGVLVGEQSSGGGDTPSLPDLCHDEQSFMRNSISYMSGYDLPEMLEYTLRSPQKARAQQENNNNSQHQKFYNVGGSTDQQYSSLVHHGSLVQPSSLMHQPTSLVHHQSSLVQPSSLPNKAHIEYTTPHTQQRYFYNKDMSTTVNNGNESPSISPVNSTLTAGGQSTDCSVSVSGSDHEMAANSDASTLQVVTPHQAHVVAISHARSAYEQYTSHHQRSENKMKKIPPAVPNKTVHASLV
jgi:hypothetical protein